MNFIKKAVSKIAYLFIANKFVFSLLFRKRKLVVFVFHDVSSAPSPFSIENDLNTPPTTFDFILNCIKNNFQIIDLRSIPNAPKSSLPSAAITFDDGYKSLFHNIFPSFEQNKIPATLFISGEIFQSDHLTSATLDYLCKHEKSFQVFFSQHYPEKNLRQAYLYCSPEKLADFFNTSPAINNEKLSSFFTEKLSMDDLNLFSQSNYITYGSHLYNHFSLAALNEADLVANISENKKVLEKFDNYYPLFSATFGVKGGDSIEKIIKSEFSFYFSKNNGINDIASTSREYLRLSLPNNISTYSDFYYRLNLTAIKNKLNII